MRATRHDFIKTFHIVPETLEAARLLVEIMLRDQRKNHLTLVSGAV
jgi:hypothetical protein